MRSNSISSISSASSSASPETTEETMQIFVKNTSGETIPLTIPPTTTISTLLSLLALRTNRPATPSLRLVHAGKHLSSPTSSLASYAIAPNSTLHLALPLPGGASSTNSATTTATTTTSATPARKKIRCSHKACRELAQRIVGDCGFCDGRFCARHRLLEDHACKGLEDCKKESHERNKERLEAERTVAIRGV
ncbi:hypothetical protein BDY21DRAFT_281956 [Lineolata rhizophorae]|uniref:Uncharacterized protein n=1 Tax=Lineolata rhizophorae TaxID=578093 RepID=A0A6A6P5R8_9PEZI|nr:hypothetical protein BDY21DRAFT_281956 [Lineolata rhizophorae]